MTRTEANLARLEAEEAARRDFARRLGTYTDATTRVTCNCGLTMSREDFLEHQEQTHHREKKLTRNSDQDPSESTDVEADGQRPLRRATSF